MGRQLSVGKIPLCGNVADLSLKQIIFIERVVIVLSIDGFIFIERGVLVLSSVILL